MERVTYKKREVGNIMENILYKEQRGKSRIEIALKNKQAIFDWFISHPDGTQKDCAIDVGVTRHTVSNHLKKIQAEIK